ncbi:hypothetical protein [Novosphingobium fluoreni]|nr:hypothetical protein [Novosphingobium fluoreni]
MFVQNQLMDLAPSGAPVPYDQNHLALYAALIDAHERATEWRTTAADLMGLDPESPKAEPCWRSHLKRAQWIVGEGMAAALQSFGKRGLPKQL